MTTPTGTIRFSDVNIELGRGSTAALNMGLAAVRTLAGVPSGTISMSQLRGKSNAYSSGTFTVREISISHVFGYDADEDTTGYSLTSGTTGLNEVAWLSEDGGGALPGSTGVVIEFGIRLPAPRNNSISLKVAGVTATVPWDAANSLYRVSGDPFGLRFKAGQNVVWVLN